MTRAGQRVADLEDQAAGLAAKVKNLRAGAFVLRASRPRQLRLAGGVW
jgi:hypothetical protein